MKEYLTDKEKRILFSALSREKKVCIEVDKQCEPREAYEESLESICKSLEHKFYYDRLFEQIRAEAYQQGKADAIEEYNKKIDYLKNCYVDACNMCTRMECDVCAISNFIEDLEELKEQENESNNIQSATVNEQDDYSCMR